MYISSHVLFSLQLWLSEVREAEADTNMASKASLRRLSGAQAGTSGRVPSDGPSSLGPSDLLHHIKQIKSSFNPAKLTAGSHVDDYFSMVSLDAGDRSFVVEVFEGMLRYHALLRAVIGPLYDEKG
jgi:hypothetical protein